MLEQEIVNRALEHYKCPEDAAKFLAVFLKESKLETKPSTDKPVTKPNTDKQATKLYKGFEAAIYLKVSEDHITKFKEHGILKDENPISTQPGNHHAKYSKQQLDQLKASNPDEYVEARICYDKGIDMEPSGYLSIEHACQIFNCSEAKIKAIVKDSENLVRTSSKPMNGGKDRIFYRKKDLACIINHATGID